jgi:hypothetical protein
MWKLYLAAVVLIGIPVYLGLINFGGNHVNKASSPTVAETPTCPGYKIIREFKTDRTISDFKPVKPATGWDCEYVVNGGLGDVQFRTEGTSVGLAFVAGGTVDTQAAHDLQGSLESEAQKLGFASR